MMTLEFDDLSPYPGDLSGDDDEWLTKVARIDPRRYRIGIDDDRPQDDEWLPLVERGRDGRWWAGRFIGSMTIEGRRLIVRPRLGIDVVEAWLDQAFGLVAPPASARHAETETFIVRLLARLWCRAVDNATRHGLPLLRLPRSHEGLFVRGRLDTRRTIRLLGEGQLRVASVTHDRSLDHPVTRVLVRAERVLAERLTGTAEWRTERVRQVLPLRRDGRVQAQGSPCDHATLGPLEEWLEAQAGPGVIGGIAERAVLRPELVKGERERLLSAAFMIRVIAAWCRARASGRR